MKNNKKFGRIALIVALLVVVCVASIAGTVAWLQDKTGTVTNTFSASNIDIWMTETVNGTSQNTDAINGGNIANSGLKMVPGNTIAKDPAVHVKEGSEPCYVFLKVTESSNLDTYISYSINDNWHNYTAVEGIYYLTAGSISDDGVVTLVPANAGYAVLVEDKVTVKDVGKTEMDALEVNDAIQPSLTFQAAAVQMANINDVDAAWEQVKADLGYTTSNP